MRTLEKDFKKIIEGLFDASKLKGDNGRFGVLGGSLEYTGAPYYSGISLLKAGADLSHIFCSPEAGVPIKSYSPELIVHPILEVYNQNEINKRISELNGIIIGPGLGRIEWIIDILKNLIKELNDKKELILFDADAFWYMVFEQKDLKSKSLKDLIIEQSQNSILTPNNREFNKLFESIFNETEKEKDQNIKINDQNIKRSDQNLINEEILKIKEKYNGLPDILEVDSKTNLIVKDAVTLSNKLNGITIIYKGEIDIVTNGQRSFLISEPGSLKRSGGQGDILSGLSMVFSYWAKIKDIDDPLIVGSCLACILLRKTSAKAFKKHFMSLTAPNIIDMIGEIFHEFYLENKL